MMSTLSLINADWIISTDEESISVTLLAKNFDITLDITLQLEIADGSVFFGINASIVVLTILWEEIPLRKKTELQQQNLYIISTMSL